MELGNKFYPFCHQASFLDCIITVTIPLLYSLPIILADNSQNCFQTVILGISNKYTYVYSPKDMYKDNNSIIYLFIVFCFFGGKSLNAIHAGLQLTVILPQPPMSQDYRHVPPWLSLALFIIVKNEIIQVFNINRMNNDVERSTVYMHYDENEQ